MYKIVEKLKRKDLWKRQSKPTESGGCDGSTTWLPQVSGVLYIYQRNGMNMLIGHACWQRWCTTSTMSGRLTRRDCVNISPLIVVCKQFHTNLCHFYTPYRRHVCLAWTTGPWVPSEALILWFYYLWWYSERLDWGWTHLEITGRHKIIIHWK